MTWGLVHPRGFGEHRPDGEDVGREELLEEYFILTHSSEEVAALKEKGEDTWRYQAIVGTAYSASRKFSRELGPLHPLEQVREFRILKRPKALSSLIMLNNQLLAVSEPLKNLVEELEPETHQFWPLKLTTRSGAEYSEPYYGMVILQWRDSFVPDKSEQFKTTEHNIFADDTKAGMSKLSFSKNIVGKAHLWRERKLAMPNIFISDVLKSEIDARGLKIWRHFPVREVEAAQCAGGVSASDTA